jgi:16S rRNA U516 pseudouridylate synthase RsuA-like enzyme
MYNSDFIQISGILLLAIAQILPTSCFAPTSAASRVTSNTHPQLHHDSLFHCTIITGQRYQCLSGKRENYDDQSDPNSPMGIRLNKVFKATHSRRQADELIASGRVSINGEQVLSKGGCKVVPFRDVVALDGKVVRGWEKMNAIGRNDDGSNEGGSVKRGKKQNGNGDELKTSSFEYVKYFKPLGVTCTTDLKIRDNIIDSIWRDGYRPRHRVYPVGRLDKETSGLIILTSDGRVVNSVLRGEKKQPKVYKVMVDGRLDEYHLQRLRVSFCACFIFEVFFKYCQYLQHAQFLNFRFIIIRMVLQLKRWLRGREERRSKIH